MKKKSSLIVLEMFMMVLKCECENETAPIPLYSGKCRNGIELCQHNLFSRHAHQRNIHFVILSAMLTIFFWRKKKNDIIFSHIIL